jgi:TRAP-type uncharacterized transport system substrate-binding protein
MSAFHWRVKVVLGLLGLLSCLIAANNYLGAYCADPERLSISGGNVCPFRERIAARMSAEINDGVVIDVLPGTNSQAICEAVDRHELDLGIVLGGFPADEYPNVRQVASLGVNPLHLLVRADSNSGSPSLNSLRGKRVSLGERGSNGELLSRLLLQFAGLQPSSGETSGDFTAEYRTEQELHRMLQDLRRAPAETRTAFAELLPDAVFIVDTLPTPLVDELVQVGRYQLVPLPYATALHVDDRRKHRRSDSALSNRQLEAATIPAFTYGVDPAVPPADCPTFGLRLLLVANEKSSPTAVRRVLESISNFVAQRHGIELKVDEEYEEFPHHDGVKAYLRGLQPFSVIDWVDDVERTFSIFGAGLAGIFALWGFMRGRNSVRADKHLRQLDRIERIIRGDERDDHAPTLPNELLNYLEGRLAQIKKSAIDDYAAGRLTGDDALVNILTLHADTRQLLSPDRIHGTDSQSPTVPASHSARLVA